MAGFTLRRRVAAPPERLFALATDFDNLPRVMSAIRRVDVLSPGPVGVGTKIRETRVMFGREAAEEMTITSFDPPHVYVLECTNHGCRYRAEMRFQPASDGDGGASDVELGFRAEALTWFTRMLSVLMRPMISMCAKQCARDLDDLQAAAEAATVEAAGAGAGEGEGEAEGEDRAEQGAVT